MKADAADSDSDEFDQDNVSPHAHKMHDTYNAANAAARAIAAATMERRRALLSPEEFAALSSEASR